MPKPQPEVDKKQVVKIETQRSFTSEYSLEVIEGHIADLLEHKAHTEAEIALWEGLKETVTAKLEE